MKLRKGTTQTERQSNTIHSLPKTVFQQFNWPPQTGLNPANDNVITTDNYPLGAHA